jgi:NADPH:quinone reductase-like Zn-dependent oxidoreductase
MKAYELCPEEGFAALQLTDRSEPPAASAMGPHDVLVRVRAVSLNYRDLLVARGSKKRAKRIVPASDGAGEVVAVGDRVTRVEVGDRVAAAFFPTWLDGGLAEVHHANALGGSLDGMLAEQVVLRESAWVKIPSRWSFEQASTLPCAGVTAWHALFEAATLRPGDTLLVQGSGGVSVFALQLARAAGASVIATSSSAEKRSRLESLGARRTIDYRADPNWGDTVRQETGGRGVDLAVEVGGAGTFDQSVKALRFGGTMSLLGLLAGTQGPIDTRALFYKNLRVHGLYVGSVAMFESLVRALEGSTIEPIIDRVFPFVEARAAYEHLESGRHFGKVVIRVD